MYVIVFFFFFQAEDGIRDDLVTGVQTCALPISLIRTGDGDVYAVIDVCSHEEYPLSEGWIEDHTIECALHGSRFDLRTGEPDSPPALRPVQIFPVKVEGTDVLVDLPDDWAKLANDL